MVAAPQGAPSATLLGQGSNLIGLDRILPGSGDRADALLLVEYRGDATGRVPTLPPGTATPTVNTLSRILTR